MTTTDAVFQRALSNDACDPVDIGDVLESAIDSFDYVVKCGAF